jgi:CRISPR-associated protein Csm4
LKFYEITIRPTSGFGTPLKGDTLFGHFCWQAAYLPELIEGGLDQAISRYPERPFAVFSSLFPKTEKGVVNYLLKKPDIPLPWLFPLSDETCEDRYTHLKEYKKKKWMLLKEDLKINLNSNHFLNDREMFDELAGYYGLSDKNMEELGVFNTTARFTQPHNTINRFTQTTGTGEFAPYVKDNIYYYPGTRLALFVLIDEMLTDIERVGKGITNIGRFGFGRDASAGLGRFDVVHSVEVEMPATQDINACYCLAPCVPERGELERAYFTPFIRFGKHGDRLAVRRNPFKTPVVMADEGAVLIPKKRDAFKRPYIGMAITDVSKIQSGCMIQGFSPYLPFKLEN